MSDLSSADYVTIASESPLPAWALASALLYKGTVFETPVKAASTTSAFSRTLATAKPTRTSCFLFGATNALGGWIIYDDDLSNGAGFTFAWSTLYLLVNGRPAVKSLLHGQINPLALGVLALGNVGLYGKQFFWPTSH